MQAKLLAGLAFTSALRVGLQRHPVGASGRLPRPPASPSGTASRAGKAFSALAPPGLGSELCSACTSRRSKNTLPAPYRVGRRGFAPIELFCRQSPTAPACGKKLDGSPTKLPPGPGLAPPLRPLWPPVRFAPGLRPAMAKRFPRMRRLGSHTQTRNADWRSAMCCAARVFVIAWRRSFSSGVEPKRVTAIQYLMGASHHHVVMGLLVGLHKDLLENIHIYVNGGLVKRVEGVVVGKV